jgi:hypothetical protein
MNTNTIIPSAQSPLLTTPLLASESRMTSKRFLSMFLSAVIGSTLIGCGSNTNSGSAVDIPSTAPVKVVATGLTYTDPISTSDWRLIKDNSSTKSRIVLNLVGPDGLTARGVGFNLNKGKCVNFGQFSGGAYAVNTRVFELKGSNPFYEAYAGTAADPVLFASGILKSGALSTGIYQKDRTREPKNLNLPLVQVAVELPSSGANCNAGDVIALNVVKSKMLPADIGGMDFILTHDVLTKAKQSEITIQVGSLVAN